MATAISLSGFLSAASTAPSWGPHIQPSVANDTNAESNVVEVSFRAAPLDWRFGNRQPIAGWGINGSIPGPTIEALEDDRVIVHFQNDLPDPIRLYWYGIETPALMSGNANSHPLVPPGESYRYDFRVPRAATYWYRAGHEPHRGTERGLYGAIIVRDPSLDLRLNLPRDEHLLFLDDIAMDQRSIRPPYPSQPLERALSQINGREGTHLLVNGSTQPMGRIDFTRPHRFRIINAANSRFMHLDFQGAHVWRIGGDAGLLRAPLEIRPPIPSSSGTPQHHGPDELEEATVANFNLTPYPPSRVLLTPGERADLIVVPDGGDQIDFVWHDFKRGIQKADRTSAGTLRLSHDPDRDGKRPPETLLSLHPLEEPFPIDLGIDTELFWPSFASGYSLEIADTVNGPWERFQGAIKLQGSFFIADLPATAHDKAFFRLQPSALVRHHEGGVNYRPPNSLVNVQRIPADNARVIQVFYTHSKPQSDGNIIFAALKKRQSPIPYPELTPELAPLARPSETLVWEIHNETAQDRNFHLSGFPFQYLSVTYSDDDFPEINQTFDAPFPEWMDTILIPKRPGRSERSRTIVRVLCELDDWRREGKITAAGLIPKPSQAGGWQFGTSMLEARDRGMRAALQIR